MSKSNVLQMACRLGGGLGCLCLALVIGVTPLWAAGDQGEERDYSKLPGYVDFSTLGKFKEEEAVVEVYLHDELLDMVSEMTVGADPELGEVLAKLDLVRVQRYELDVKRIEDVEKKTESMAAKLEGQGWMQVVRVRERDEHIYVYFKLGKEMLNGITVVAIEDEFVTLANVVGEIDPKAVGKLGRRFNIDELDPDVLDKWDQHHGKSASQDSTKKDKDDSKKDNDR
jgi:hypothetical protein